MRGYRIFVTDMNVILGCALITSSDKDLYN